MSATQDVASPQPKKKQRTTPTPVQELVAHAVDAALEKKAHDIVVMDVRAVSGVADYFVVCTGDSDLQVKAIMEAIEERIRERCREKPWHIEGREHRQWVLLDYVDLVVHIFAAEKRAFYDLERLWGDAPSEHVPDDADSAAVVQLLHEKSA